MPDSAAIINSVAYDRSGKRIARVEPEQAREFLAANPEAFLWLGLHEPDADMLALLQSQFDLHELAIEDALCAHQRPKIEPTGTPASLSCTPRNAKATVSCSARRICSSAPIS